MNENILINPRKSAAKVLSLLRTPHHAPRTNNERGAALIIVLWVTLILSVIALELAYNSKLELRALNYTRERLQSTELARAAFARAIIWLSDPKNRALAPLMRFEYEEWLKPSENDLTAPRENLLKNEKGGLAGKYTIEIIDESGKMNINSADATTLARLLQLSGAVEPPKLADAIIQYRASRPGATILSLDELLNVPGTDAKLLYGEDKNNNGKLDPGEDDNSDGHLNTGLAAFITTSPHALISLNRAPAQLIQAYFNLNDDQVKEFTDLRAALPDGFVSVDEMKTLSWFDSTQLEKLKSTFSVESDRFSVHVHSVSGNETISTEIVVSVGITPTGPVPFIWQEKSF